MFVQGVRNSRQPCPVFDQFKKFHGGKEFDAVGRGIPQRLEQPGRHQNPHIRRLAVQNPRHLLASEPGRCLLQLPYELIRVLSHG